MAATGSNLSRTLSSPKTLDVLDPSPDEESPASFAPSSKTNGYFPAQNGPASSSSAFGVRLPSYPTLLSQIQRYSSYAFTVFAAMHLTNTALIPLLTRSAPAATPYLLLTRPYYQSWPLAEPALVLAPLAAHIASGLALRLHRRAVLLAHYGRRDAGAPTAAGAPWPAVSAISASGFASAWLVAGHAGINRALPAWADDGGATIGLEWVGHGVARAPALGALGFTVLVAVVGGHMVWGWAKWLGATPGPAVAGESAQRVLSRKRRWWGVWGATAAVVGLWLAGGVGVVARAGRVDGWVGEAYDRLYASLPVLGKYI